MREPIDRETIPALQTLLARCFKQPDERTEQAIRSTTLGSEIRRRANTLGITIDPQPVPDQPREAYLRTFEAYEGEFAPPAESAYKHWWDGTERGILSGPPAHDMQQRYEELDATIPAAYPADHIALLLEYSSLLLESGNTAAYLDFHDQHYDWIPAFHDRIEQTGDEPFYQWAVTTAETVLDRTKAHLQDQTDEK